MGGGRVPRRLRECADGPDLEGHLRRPHQGKLRQGVGRLRNRQPAEAGAADRPPVFRTGRRTDHAEGDHMTRGMMMLTVAAGREAAMKNWRYIALSASLETSLVWALTFGGCAAGLAYMQSNR